LAPPIEGKRGALRVRKKGGGGSQNDLSRRVRTTYFNKGMQKGGGGK